jgi:hypothetical protein
LQFITPTWNQSQAIGRQEGQSCADPWSQHAHHHLLLLLLLTLHLYSVTKKLVMGWPRRVFELR